jgi:hypothetical protein
MTKTTQPYRLHILDNGSTDSELVSYLNQLAQKQKGYFKHYPNPVSLAECYNFLLQTVYQENCVFFPTRFLVDNEWLEDLLTSLDTIQSCGVACIRPIDTKISFTPLLHNSWHEEDDYLENVIATRDKINTVIAFKKKVVDEVGTFDVRLNSPSFEISEFCFRVKINGYNNYYIRKQSCYQLPIENPILFPQITKENIENFKQAIETMYKVKTFIK